MKKISSISRYFISFIIIVGIWYTYISNIVVSNSFVVRVQQENQDHNVAISPNEVKCDCSSNGSSSSVDINSNNNNNDKNRKKLSRITINNRINEKKNNTNNNGISIDLISIGSLFRSEYMMKQKETWASHSSIRSFYGFTELDDDNPYCSVDLDIIEYMDQCKDKSINVWDSSMKRNNYNTTVSNVFRSKHYGTDTMKKKGIKSGWICAQKRPGFAVGKIGRLYKEDALKERNKNSKSHSPEEEIIDDNEVLDSILPNYLIVMDDDTYINMENFISYILENNNNQQTQEEEKAKIYAGCLRGDPSVFEKNHIHWVYPWGGFGLILNRSSIKRLIMPIHCNDHPTTFNNKKSTTNSSNKNYIEFVCSRIKQNLLGEEKLFQNGMSISDLAYALSSRKYFCMHSDHLTSYLIHYYNLSDFYSDDGGDINDKNNEFDFSRLHEYNYNANCAFDGVKRCHPKSSHICHRIDSETMETYHSSTKS